LARPRRAVLGALRAPAAAAPASVLTKKPRSARLLSFAWPDFVVCWRALGARSSARFARLRRRPRGALGARSSGARRRRPRGAFGARSSGGSRPAAAAPASVLERLGAWHRAFFALAGFRRLFCAPSARGPRA